MTPDHVTRLAKMRVIQLSHSLEVLLADKKGGDIVQHIADVLQERAAESMTALCICDATKTNEVMIHQNEVKRYDEFMAALCDIAREGVARAGELSREDREDLLDILVQTEDGQEEARTLGLIDDA